MQINIRLDNQQPIKAERLNQKNIKMGTPIKESITNFIVCIAFHFLERKEN